MQNHLTTFDFEGAPVRTIDRNGEPWFVLADVCRVLEISNSRDAASRLDDDEKQTLDLQGVGITDGAKINNLGAGTGNNIAWTINESGLYSLVITSRKPEAKRFKKWITAEVLPTIRKTGRYFVNTEPDVPDSYDGAIAAEAALIARSLREMFDAVYDHVDINQRKLAIVNNVRRKTGLDMASLIGVPLSLPAPEEFQDRYFTVTDLGKMAEPAIPAKAFNQRLQRSGLQEETRDRKNTLVWTLTQAGKDFGRYFDTGKSHSGGAPVQQIKWRREVLSAMGLAGTA